MNTTLSRAFVRSTRTIPSHLNTTVPRRQPISTAAKLRSALPADLRNIFSTGSSSTVRGAKPDWSVQRRHLWSAAQVFVPAMGFFLGWPLVAEAIVGDRL